jgi:hypothetical protein
VTQNDAFILGATKINVGTLGASNFPVKVIAPAGVVGGYLKWASGGSLEIMPQGIVGASIGGATTAGLGYLLGVTESYPFTGPACFYLAATGSTAVAYLNWHFSAGASLA